MCIVYYLTTSCTYVLRFKNELSVYKIDENCGLPNEAPPLSIRPLVPLCSTQKQGHQIFLQNGQYFLKGIKSVRYKKPILNFKASSNVVPTYYYFY